ncbi:MAG: Ig-like domain-containing protein [Chitinophagales bacterium]
MRYKRRGFYWKVLILGLVFQLITASYLPAATRYVYDNNNRLQSVTYDNGRVDTYTFDANGNLLTVTTSTNPTISLNKTRISMNIGQIEQLTATSSQPVTWTSNQSWVATVDSTGKVTAMAVGAAVIKASVTGGFETCTVTVSGEVTGVTLDKSRLNLSVGGETATLIATVTPEEAANKSVTWKSSNSSVATVDDNGIVTSEGAGTAVISVTTLDGGFTATCNVTVAGATALQMVSGGEDHTMCLKQDGTVWCWGDNSKKQLGGTLVTDGTAVQSQGLANITEIDAGDLHSAALDQNGNVYAWGANDSGQLGSSPHPTYPYPIASGVKSVRCGSSHTVLLKNDGTVSTCGLNDKGQLGDGSTVLNSKNLVQVQERFEVNGTTQIQPLTDVKAIDAGGNFTVALKNDGTLWAWGDSTSGQLGNGSTTLSRYAVKVSNLSNVEAFRCGGSHVVALGPNETVWIWGNDNTLPTQMEGLTGVKTIATGGSHTIILKKDGTVWAWGTNTKGQLGDGTTSKKTKPVEITALRYNVKSIACGYRHSLAIMKDESLYVWGDNSSGQLGLSSGTTIKTPTPTTILNQPVTGVTLDKPTLALDLEGEQKTLVATVLPSNATNKKVTWSSDNTAFATVKGGIVTPVGIGTTTITVTADEGGFHEHCQVTVTANLKPVTGITLTPESYTLIVGDSPYTLTATVQPPDATNRKVFWSSNNTSIATVNSNGAVTPVAEGTALITATTQEPSFSDTCNITVKKGILAAAGGLSHTVCLQTDNKVYSWGLNSSGQLGNNGTSNSMVSVKAKLNANEDLIDIKAIDCGNTHTVALSNNNTAYTWGGNTYGQLGIGNTTNQLTASSIGTNITSIHCGTNHTVLINSNGSVLTCGYNNKGQLGDGTTVNKVTPTAINLTANSNFVAVDAGDTFTIAMKNGGALWAWGYNSSGQLGIGATTTAKLSPVQVKGYDTDYISGVQAVCCGSNHVVALKDGEVLTWGDNSKGQLGIGTKTDKTRPVKIGNLSNVIAIAAGGNYSMALKSDGTVWAWGENTYGQLGNQTTTLSTQPVQVSGITNVDSIACGINHSLAIKGSILWTWGYNNYGQLGLGDNSTTQKTSPVKATVVNN